MWLEAATRPPKRPAFAARGAILAAGLATLRDTARWDAARERYLAEPDGKYLCVPVFRATGRRVDRAHLESP